MTKQTNEDTPDKGRWWRKNWFFGKTEKTDRKKLFSILSENTLVCPRCRRTVIDVQENRNAHRVSCVRIPSPENRNAQWGVKTRRVR